ncbi:hypothetical protein COCCADRAFT_30867, partial [Bipolaris zeicola 26-R-13]
MPGGTVGLILSTVAPANSDICSVREMVDSQSQTDLTKALDSCTPCDVLSNKIIREIKVLLSSMQQFLRKGTPDQCFKLLPEEFKSDERFKRINSLRTPVPATPQPHQPQDLPTLAEEYFRPSIPDRGNRLKRLVKVAQHITEFQIQDNVDLGKAYNEESIQETPIAQTGATVDPGSVCDADSTLEPSIARAAAIFNKITSKQDTKGTI